MIKASAILIAVFCFTWLLRNRSAAERHMVWVAAIISAALLPILSFLLPSWELPLVPRVAAALPALSPAKTNPSLSHRTDVTFHADGIEPGVVALTRIWNGVWLAGSITSLFLFGIGVKKQRQFALRSSRLSDPVLLRMAADIAHQFGYRRTIHLRKSMDPCMPMTWGIVRPQILFPNCVDSWSGERKRMVIAHELAHVRRLDWFFQTMAQMACAVFWFNPFFWIACNRLQRESEHACDDTVINLGLDAREYASQLLQVARALTQSDGVWATTLAMARQSTLEKRFTALLKPKSNRRAVTRKTVLFVTIIALSLVLPLAAMRVIPNMVDEPGAPDATAAVPMVEQYTTPPLYSDEARARGIEGIVTVEVRVGVYGSVERLRIVKGLGYGLDENALLAVRDWRFFPGKRDGVAVEATTQIDVEFNLRNAELNELIANDMATRIGPGVSPPQVIHRIEPQYSTATLRQKPAGAVVLDAVILEDGTPRIVRVIRSLDWELDEIAINAVKQWRFSPAMKDGRFVRVRMNVAVDFHIQS
jgi:TonB family protein